MKTHDGRADPGLKWRPFDKAKGSRQLRPPEHKPVLVLCASREAGMPEAVCVGYRKNAVGDKQSPYFVVPGHGGEVLAWCDCLPDIGVHPLWEGARRVGGVLKEAISR